MAKTKFSDEACAIILMHHTIKNLNRALSSEIAYIYGDNADYSRSFREVARGFSDSEQYKKYLTQAHNDSKSIYTRLQPQTLFEYNLYLNHLIMFLKQYPGAPLSAAIENAKQELKFGSPKFYSDYAPSRTASAEDLVRGLKFMKCLVGELYNVPPQKVRIPESGVVVNERINLECEREISKAGKARAKGSGKTQAKGARVLGGAELISPFSLDNLTVAESTSSKKKSKQPGEEE